MEQVLDYVDKKVWTFDDYLNLAENHDFYYEILEGELKLVAKPILNHQWVAGELFRIFKDKVEDTGDGFVLQEVDVVASKKRVFAPDIVIIKKESMNAATCRNIKGVPDMVVEVTSSSTRSYDLGEKKYFYEKIGIEEYWACDYMKKQVYVFCLTDNRFVRSVIKESPVFCTLFGFEIDVYNIFNRLPFPID